MERGNCFFYHLLEMAMRRVLLAGVGCVISFLTFGSGSVSAQGGYYVPIPSQGVGTQPLLNPFLNLGNSNNLNGVGGVGTNNSAIQYFLGTIPEQQRRANAAVINNEFYQLEGAAGVAPGRTPDEIDTLLQPLPGTGHPIVFNNTGSYFNTLRAGPRSGLTQQLPRLR
jgi:hypothetical protein